MVGDQFLKSTFDTLTSMQQATSAAAKTAKGNEGVKLFMGEFFNTKQFNPNFGSVGLTRMLNPLIQALNKNKKLPKYILIFPEIDFLSMLAQQASTSSVVIGAAIHWLIKEYDILLDRRKMNLLDRKPGALINNCDIFPKVIWVRILKRPLLQWATPHIKEMLSLRGKFNSILEERLWDSKDGFHYIMSIEVDSNSFNLTGGLTTAFQKQFWIEIDKAIYKLDINKITLKPRRFNEQQQRTTEQKAPRRSGMLALIKLERRFKLPTPPANHRKRSPDSKRRSPDPRNSHRSPRKREKNRHSSSRRSPRRKDSSHRNRCRHRRSRERSPHGKSRSHNRRR